MRDDDVDQRNTKCIIRLRLSARAVMQLIDRNSHSLSLSLSLSVAAGANPAGCPNLNEDASMKIAIAKGSVKREINGDFFLYFDREARNALFDVLKKCVREDAGNCQFHLISPAVMEDNKGLSSPPIAWELGV